MEDGRKYWKCKKCHGLGTIDLGISIYGNRCIRKCSKCKDLRESEVENYAVMRVKAAGGEIRKVKWIGRNGAPDRRVMLPWLRCWVEFKRPGKGLEPHQVREHERMKAMGEDVRVIDTKEKVDALFEKV